MPDEPNLKIQVAATLDELESVRGLMRAFISWHRKRHFDQLSILDLYFDPAGFESELAGLPGRYGSPDGCLLLALFNGEPAGCVGLRRLDEQTCEMKRMFVTEEFQGLGIGLALGRQILEHGRSLGYERMVLDSGAKQFEAHQLYRKLGFVDTEPYYELPTVVRDWLVFMTFSLSGVAQSK